MDLAEVKRYFIRIKSRSKRLKSDEAFSMYLFLYKGYEEHHNYFNPRLRNRGGRADALLFIESGLKQKQK